MTTRHPVFAAILALLLAAASVMSGPAMAGGDAGRTVELCSHDGPVTVTLDAQGNPVVPHRPCPLCLAAQDIALPPAPVTPVRPAGFARALASHPADALVALRPVPAPAARAPPRPV